MVDLTARSLITAAAAVARRTVVMALEAPAAASAAVVQAQTAIPTITRYLGPAGLVATLEVMGAMAVRAPWLAAMALRDQAALMARLAIAPRQGATQILPG